MRIKASSQNLKVKILPNRQKPWAVQVVKEITQFLQRQGITIVPKNADATICVGGDGTIYYNNYRKKLEGKIIGIGTETSFICQLTRKNWKERLWALLKGEGSRRIRLRTKQDGLGLTALSDIVIHTHDYRIIKIFVKVRRRTSIFEGDGVIIATPMGSTSYAYSAGGPKIAADKKAILVVPICPYKRAFRPLVLRPPLARISIWSDRTSDLVIDGILIGRLKKGERVQVHTGKEVVFG